MSAPYTGHCACGLVSATIAGEPLSIRLCFCRQCQQAAGGAATTNAVFNFSDIVMSGDLGHHQYVAASGNILSTYFCRSCGNPVYAQSSARKHLASIRLGFLDIDHGLKPDAAIWLSEAPDWATVDPQLPHYSQQAPPPGTPTT